MQLLSVEKDWKHVLMKKVATLNTCCDIACPTFQLPHITMGTFQSNRRQPTTGSFQSLQRLKEHNKPSVGWKSLAIHKLVWWHFHVGWASGLQFVFFWQHKESEVCMNNTHTHTHTFNGPFSGTTRVSCYHKGKTNLDFTKARDSEWQWHQLGHMQVCTYLQTDNRASTPPLLPPNQQHQSTESILCILDIFVHE